jgi:glycosyltransferase involved in cell wall biosynthesis
VAAQLREADSEIHVVFVGGDIYQAGISEPVLRDYAGRLKCLDRIHFLGPRDDVNALLGNFDLFVFPCRHEAFGLSVLEAMRAGLPVLIDKDSGGTLGLITHLASGEVVDFSEPELVARRIQSLIQNPGELSRYGVRARETFLAKFTSDIFLKETVGFYSEVLDRQATRS